MARKRGGGRREGGATGGPQDDPSETKLCPVCALPFANRKKWAARGQWERVVYCSERCRRAARRGRAD